MPDNRPQVPGPPLGLPARLFLALLLPLILPAPRAGAQDAMLPRAVNPHWKPEACASCHTQLAGQITPIPRQRIEPLCVSCHDGDRAREEPHPVGRRFDLQASMTRPNWPLVGNRVTCITCHDIRLQCDPNAQRPPANGAFLRGREHAAQNQPFCANCHRPDAYPKYNPHAMLLPGTEDRIDRQKCLFCHTTVPDHNEDQRTGNPQLRKPELQICLSCHRQHVDPYSRGHIGAQVPDAMQAYMRARELLGLTKPPSPQLLAQLQSEHARPTRLALDREARINCSTCHNPHEYGTFPASSVLSYRGIRIIDGRTLSPVRGDQWCKHCHDF